MNALRLHRNAAVILLSGLLLEGLALGLAREGNLRDGSVAFVSGYLAMSVMYVAAVFYVFNYCHYDKGPFVLGVGIAVVLRIPCSSPPPAFSDDTLPLPVGRSHDFVLVDLAVMALLARRLISAG